MSSPFWTFSLAVYGASADHDECLNLQDQLDWVAIDHGTVAVVLTPA